MKIEHRDGKVYLDGEYAKPGFSFTDDMLKARAAGRKAETRRLPRKQPEITGHSAWPPTPIRAVYDLNTIKPKFEVNQLVYVKEALVCGGNGCAYYWSDQKPVIARDPFLPWRWQRDRLPAIFMPGDAARHFDRIVEVKAERLQDITTENIIAEGIASPGVGVDLSAFNGYGELLVRNNFHELWNSINPKHPWDSNPWVWVYKFEVIR